MGNGQLKSLMCDLTSWERPAEKQKTPDLGIRCCSN